MIRKQAKSKGDSRPDYFRLPFEVHYAGAISVTSYEFKSDVDVKRFKDIKAVHMEQGRAWGVTFLCKNNNGPQLYCCLIDGHDEVAPDWLELQNEDDVSMNYGCDYRVEIKDKEIYFVDEEVDDSDEMDYCGLDCYWHYEIASESPEYLILDALGTRLKVNCEGFPLDTDGNPTGEQQIFKLEELNSEELEDYSTDSIWEAKASWIEDQLNRYFPKDKSLRLSFQSE